MKKLLSITAVILVVAVVSVGVRWILERASLSNPAVNGSARVPPYYSYFMPADFKGWVVIDYEVPGESELSFQSGTYLVRINESGRSKTSTPYFGKYSTPMMRHYFSGSMELEGGKILSHSDGNPQCPGDNQSAPFREWFFVGSTAEFSASKFPCS